MIAACLGLEAIPMVGAAFAAVIAFRFLKYATKRTTKSRLYFTILWSTVSVIIHAYGFITGAWHGPLLHHALTISNGLVIIGWSLVGSAFLGGLKETMDRLRKAEP